MNIQIASNSRTFFSGCGIRRERKCAVRGVRPNLQGKWFLWAKYALFTLVCQFVVTYPVIG